MKNLTSFNRANLGELHADIDAALKAVGEKYGISLKTGSFGFSEKEFSFRTTGKILVDGEAPVTTIPGLTAIGTEFVYGGKLYRVVEHKNAPKFNIIALNLSTNTRFKFTNNDVSRLIKK